MNQSIKLLSEDLVVYPISIYYGTSLSSNAHHGMSMNTKEEQSFKTKYIFFIVSADKNQWKLQNTVSFSIKIQILIDFCVLTRLETFKLVTSPIKLSKDENTEFVFISKKIKYKYKCVL